MKSIKLNAFAKVNLSLNITGRENGMHAIDSIMMSVDAYDAVTVSERDDGKVTVRFLNADIPAEDNTAYKAARAVTDAIGGPGCDIVIEKGIPVGAGLGGSSADAAAILRALDLFYRLPERGVDMRGLALSVGSDVPFMLTGGTARVRSTGGDMYFFKNKLQLFGVGLMSDSVSTKEAYARFDVLHPGLSHLPSDNDRLTELLMSGDSGALALLGNALYDPAAELAPSVAKNADVLRGYGAAVNMTGSGGMVTGWFTDIQAFAECAMALRGTPGFKALAPAPCGILHEWL